VTDTLAKIPGDDRKPMVGDVWRGVLHQTQIATRYFGPGDPFEMLARMEREIVDWPSLWEFVGRVVPVDHPGVEAVRKVITDTRADASECRRCEFIATADHLEARADALASLLAVITGEAS
jgi:hypothetical protein